MFTKLTLNISEAVIEKAKKTARKKRTSVSRLVEEYLKNLSHKNKDTVVSSIIKNAPVKKTRRGTEKKILKMNLLRKYGS